MIYALHNKKGEKVLTIAPLSNATITSMFKTPNFYGVFFFTKANGILVIDQQHIKIKSQYILFYYPYQKLSIEGDFEGVFIQFHPDFFCIDIHARDIGCQGLLFNNFFNDFLLPCSNEEFEDLFSFQLQIKNELLKKDVGQLDMVSSQLKMFLINAVRIKKKGQEKELPSKDNLHHQIERLIENNFASEPSSEFYTKELGVSLTTFNRLCKKYFQNSFVTILNLKRIAIAKNLLFLTNTSIKDIAYQVGFNDPLYFSRVFKKHSGISPKEFREQLKNNRLV
ncbi:AraC family transcriptional regulator [Aquimarina sp. 2201CG5-10]|uniref:AraC family transcriptional regulator n=1 Tax=Aquimarina callyspongiae TaxID=3098150 RepID=UPI002AB563EF|nr:AraC family transcriptional regulator [Aquimarina sp. 2201CG5-10]MDY8134737.1 AraC family transcriptional regulator [Aquimarina sp. 2201CG5-10]